jgi:hypothetical protein
LDQEFQEAVSGYRRVLKRLEHDNLIACWISHFLI